MDISSRALRVTLFGQRTLPPWHCTITLLESLTVNIALRAVVGQFYQFKTSCPSFALRYAWSTGIGDAVLLLNLKFVASARFYHPHSILNRCKAQLFPHAGLFLEVRRAHLQYFQLQYKLKLEQAFDTMISGHQVQLSVAFNLSSSRL